MNVTEGDICMYRHRHTFVWTRTQQAWKQACSHINTTHVNTHSHTHSHRQTDRQNINTLHTAHTFKAITFTSISTQDRHAHAHTQTPRTWTLATLNKDNHKSNPPHPTPSTVPWDDWQQQKLSVCSCCARCLSSWRCSCGPGVGPRCAVWTWCPSRSQRLVPCPRDLAVCHAVSPLHPSPAGQVRLVILWILLSWQQLRVTSGWTAVIQNSSMPTKRQFKTQVTKSQLKVGSKFWSLHKYLSIYRVTSGQIFVFQNSSMPVQNKSQVKNQDHSFGHYTSIIYVNQEGHLRTNNTFKILQVTKSVKSGIRVLVITQVPVHQQGHLGGGKPSIN